MHKYLKDIGVKEDEMSQNWLPDEKRQVKWEKQRQKYGFDEREIWSLDITYCMWLYERLMMFKDINKLENTTKNKYGKYKYTEYECVCFILECLKAYIKAKPYLIGQKINNKIYKNMRKAHKLLGHILPILWT